VKNHSLALIALSLVILTVPATAGVVFDNYPINEYVGGWTINGGYIVSDSFTLTSAATVNGVNFGVWLSYGSTITNVDWSIGTAPYGNSLDSGAGAALSSTPLGGLADGVYPVFSSTFSFPDLNLAAATYYLTLQNAVVTNGGAAFWNINNGPGIDVWESARGNISPNDCYLVTFGTWGTCASAFQILGPGGGAIPEPATWTLLGSGILVAFALRRKATRG
jgi:hypothetical protein